MLLQTRGWVLQHAGYRVSTAESHTAALHVLDTTRVDVCVLCHTLSSAQRTSVKATTNELWPEAQFLQLHKMVSQALEINEPGALNVGDGPAALLTGVQKLIGPRTAAISDNGVSGGYGRQC